MRPKYQIHSFWLAVIGALWLTVAYSQPLLHALRDYNTSGVTQLLLLCVVAILYTLLLLFARMLRVLLPSVVLLFTIAAVVRFYMLQYQVIVDPSMVVNLLETDSREALDVITRGSVLQVLLWGVFPALLLVVFARRESSAWTTRALQFSAASILAVVLLTGAFYSHYGDFASLFRNHRDIKYRIIPFNAVSSLVSVLKRTLAQPEQLIVIGTDASRSDDDERLQVLVLVVGETVRADHLGLNGYERDTTPQLRQLAEQGELVSLANTVSCGTATAISVPCMFSFATADRYDDTARATTNVLDILQQVNVRVSWLENNSGCKNVCDRLPTTVVDQSDCVANCLDTQLLPLLTQQLKAINRDSVIVLHTIGSHGPAYYKRSSSANKAFLPECQTHELSDCEVANIVNAYDNSIREFDAFNAAVIRQLQALPANIDARFMYISDHGESLGDNGLYLHGLPNWLAPQEQRHVAWLLWPEQAWGEIDQHQEETFSHDYLAHTLLGFFGVATALYDPQMDLNQVFMRHDSSWQVAQTKDN